MTATATAPARARVAPTRVAPRPTPRSTAEGRSRRAPDLRVVEAPPRRYPARAVGLVAVLLVFGSMLASAVVHSVLVSGQARIDDLGRQITAAEKGLAQDRLELARLSSPERIASEAERLGLVVAERQTWIRPGSDDEPVVTGEDPTDADGTTDGDVDGTSGPRSGAEELAAPAGDTGVRR